MGTEQRPSVAPPSIVNFIKSSTKAMALTDRANQKIQTNPISNSSTDKAQQRVWAPGSDLGRHTTKGNTSKSLTKCSCKQLQLTLSIKYSNLGTIQLLCHLGARRVSSEPADSNSSVPRFWTCSSSSIISLPQSSTAVAPIRTTISQHAKLWGPTNCQGTPLQGGPRTTTARQTGQVHPARAPPKMSLGIWSVRWLPCVAFLPPFILSRTVRTTPLLSLLVYFPSEVQFLYAAVGRTALAMGQLPQQVLPLLLLFPRLLV